MTAHSRAMKISEFGESIPVYESLGGEPTPASEQRWPGMNLRARGIAIPVDSFEVFLEAARSLNALAADHRTRAFVIAGLPEACERFGVQKVAPHFAFAPTNLSLPKDFLHVIERISEPSPQR